METEKQSKLIVKETLDTKKFTYQITNEYGEAQPFTVLNLYRHIGYPMRVIQNEMSNGQDAVINLSKRYLPLTMLWYGEQRLKQFYEEHRKKLPTAYAIPIEKVLKAYRRFNEKAESCQKTDTTILDEDRETLAPIFTQELMKFYLTADNYLNTAMTNDSIRRAFIEILAQRIVVRIVIEDSLSLGMEMDKETTDIDIAQAKALTSLCGGNHTGVQDRLRLYHDKIEDLSLMEVNIIFNKLQAHLKQVAETEMKKYEERLAERQAAATTKKKPKATTERAKERAQDPNRRGKTVKAKKVKSKVQTMDESLAALQARFNSR